jgi:3-phosphoinositide dependent protein kinase-1
MFSGTESQTDPEIRLQFAENRDLRKYFAQRSYARHLRNPTLKGQLICDILMRMRFIHSHQIIRRDSKPKNIFLDKNWRGLIGDFGWCRAMSGKGPPTREAGSPFYAAPAMLRKTFYTTGKLLFLRLD